MRFEKEFCVLVLGVKRGNKIDSHKILYIPVFDIVGKTAFGSQGATIDSPMGSCVFKQIASSPIFSHWGLLQYLEFARPLNTTATLKKIKRSL